MFIMRERLALMEQWNERMSQRVLLLPALSIRFFLSFFPFLSILFSLFIHSIHFQFGTHSFPYWKLFLPLAHFIFQKLTFIFSLLGFSLFQNEKNNRVRGNRTFFLTSSSSQVLKSSSSQVRVHFHTFFATICLIIDREGDKIAIYIWRGRKEMEEKVSTVWSTLFLLLSLISLILQW